MSISSSGSHRHGNTWSDGIHGQRSHCYTEQGFLSSVGGAAASRGSRLIEAKVDLLAKLLISTPGIRRGTTAQQSPATPAIGRL